MPQDRTDKDHGSAFTSNCRFIEPSFTIGLLPRRITLILSLVALACVLLLLGCSEDPGVNGLHVKSPATGEKDLAAKSSYAFAITKSFTDAAGKMTTAPSYRVYVANYDLDAANFAMTLDKPLTSEDRLRVVFSLVGEQGGTEKTPLKGGTESKVWLDRSTLTGEVKVNSVSGDTMSCDVDLSAGETSIKGSFTAKILTRK